MDGEDRNGRLLGNSPPAHAPGHSLHIRGVRYLRGSGCPFREGCFLRRVIQQAQEWKIIVANYHLFFSYSASTGQGFPVHFDAVVCDEAHRLTEAARAAATIHSSAEDWTRMMDFGRGRILPRTEWLSREEREKCASSMEFVRKEAVRLFDGWKKQIRRGEVFTDEIFPPADRRN